MLQIHNSLTKQKETFQPIDPQNVRMYVCGMTVYDFCHIGHARVLVVFDMVYRYLCERYGASHVKYIRNITDIDDKIIKRAHENGELVSELTARFIAEMNKDADSLGVLRPNAEPRATDYIAGIIQMVQTLIAKGNAYAAKNGDVYYDVSSFPNYGQLSARNLEEDRTGARVEIDEAKDDPMDFVLWKAAKPGEPYWESPWGAGRPGWHIECSVMSTECLGANFDIHGGGVDLKFPHHENEIAQSEAATGQHFSNLWMHNGHVMVDTEKMSKSLGNFFTVREVLKRYAPEVVRYFILASHYRSPLNYSQENLDHAKSAMDRFYTALRGLPISAVSDAELGAYGKRFYAALDDDFNSAEAVAVLFDVARDINRLRAEGDMPGAQRLAGVLSRLGATLGLLQADADGFLKGVSGNAGLSDAEIDSLVEQRVVAKQTKNWKEADRVRDVLKAKGVVVEDFPHGSTWRRA